MRTNLARRRLPILPRQRCEQYFCFFFQAEDGIRDVAVTGVQTCALPISAQGPPDLLTQEPELGDDLGRRQALGEIGRASCRERVYIFVVPASFIKKRAYPEPCEPI